MLINIADIVIGDDVLFEALKVHLCNIKTVVSGSSIEEGHSDLLSEMHHQVLLTFLSNLKVGVGGGGDFVSELSCLTKEGTVEEHSQEVVVGDGWLLHQ